MSSCNVQDLYIYFALNYFRYICFQTLPHTVLLKNTILWIYQNEMTNINVIKPIWLLHIYYLINYPNYLGQNLLNLVLQCFLTVFIEESWSNDLINDFMHGLYTYIALHYWCYICLQALQHIVLLKNTLLRNLD